MKTLWRYKLWLLGVLVLIAIGVVVLVARPKRVSGQPTPAPPEVEVVQVEQKDVPIYGDWIGTLDGLVNADVRAQVTGYLQEQGYQEGAFVKKGQLLFQIDSRPFQAALDQAEGQLAQAKAALANAEAVQGRTQLDVDRYTPLAREHAATQQDLDNAIQNNLAAKANIETAKAQIRTDEAAVETAKINLGFTTLVAPIDGIAGQAQLQVGALVNPASGPVTRTPCGSRSPRTSTPGPTPDRPATCTPTTTSTCGPRHQEAGASPSAAPPSRPAPARTARS